MLDRGRQIAGVVQIMIEHNAAGAHGDEQVTQRRLHDANRSLRPPNALQHPIDPAAAAMQQFLDGFVREFIADRA